MTPPTILIVDDDREHAAGILELLHTHDHAAIVVHSGEDAVALAAHTPLALVVMEVRLPDMNGFAAYQRLRALHPRAEFLLMSGFDPEHLIREAAADAVVVALEAPLGPWGVARAVEEADPGGVVLVRLEQPDALDPVLTGLRTTGLAVNGPCNSVAAVAEIDLAPGPTLLLAEDSLMEGLWLLLALRARSTDSTAIIGYHPARQGGDRPAAGEASGQPTFLSKPLDPAALLAWVAARIGRERA